MPAFLPKPSSLFTGALVLMVAPTSSVSVLLFWGMVTFNLLVMYRVPKGFLSLPKDRLPWLI